VPGGIGSAQELSVFVTTPFQRPGFAAELAALGVGGVLADAEIHVAPFGTTELGAALEIGFADGDADRFGALQLLLVDGGVEGGDAGFGDLALRVLGGDALLFEQTVSTLAELAALFDGTAIALRDFEGPLRAELEATSPGGGWIFGGRLLVAAQIPEPGTAAMLGLGLVLLAARRRWTARC
jgi:PEP-CTERM motif